MTWVRLDDSFPEHPKIARLGDTALAMFVVGLAYCNRNLTDGFIPNQVGLGQLRYCDGNPVPAIRELEKVGCWDKVPGGWQVHDYFDYQPSRESVLKDREKERLKKRKQRSPRDSQPVSPAVSPGDSPRDTFGNLTYPVPVPNPVVEEHEVHAVVPLDADRQHALKLLLGVLPRSENGTALMMENLARRLPPASLHKVRESVIERGRELTNPIGYAVNALRSEEREIREARQQRP